MRRNLSCGLLLALALPAITAPVLAADTIAPPDQLLPPMGGEGGGTFQGHCREGDILVALDLRTADDVDWVAPVCATVYGPRQLGQGRVTSKGFGGPRGSFGLSGVRNPRPSSPGSRWATKVWPPSSSTMSICSAAWPCRTSP